MALLGFHPLSLSAEDCAVGYSSENGSCQPCTPGLYSKNVTAGCSPCPSGTAAGARSDQGLRFFSFDPSTKQAGFTLKNFADPASAAESGWGAEGLVFDGKDDYVELEPWRIGGAMSVEAFVKYESFNYYSRVFDFGAGGHEHFDSIYLSNYETLSNALWSVRQEISKKNMRTASKFWTKRRALRPPIFFLELISWVTTGIIEP